MKVILLISLLFVIDVFSLNKAWIADNSGTNVIGDETVLGSKEVKKNVGMKKHKFPFLPVVVAAALIGGFVAEAVKG
ncbi:hypothetical protein RB195_011136 [Necator americanus]|uniref:Uncharacterized protein n=1 Tax=Necator americanus TaxID=51031 RepID=A0ABR1D179_NECAM